MKRIEMLLLALLIGGCAAHPEMGREYAPDGLERSPRDATLRILSGFAEKRGDEEMAEEIADVYNIDREKAVDVAELTRKVFARTESFGVFYIYDVIIEKGHSWPGLIYDVNEAGNIEHVYTTTCFRGFGEYRPQAACLLTEEDYGRWAMVKSHSGDRCFSDKGPVGCLGEGDKLLFENATLLEPDGKHVFFYSGKEAEAKREELFELWGAYLARAMPPGYDVADGTKLEDPEGYMTTWNQLLMYSWFYHPLGGDMMPGFDTPAFRRQFHITMEDAAAGVRTAANIYTEMWGWRRVREFLTTADWLDVVFRRYADLKVAGLLDTNMNEPATLGSAGQVTRLILAHENRTVYSLAYGTYKIYSNGCVQRMLITQAPVAVWELERFGIMRIESEMEIQLPTIHELLKFSNLKEFSNENDVLPPGKRIFLPLFLGAEEAGSVLIAEGITLPNGALGKACTMALPTSVPTDVGDRQVTLDGGVQE